MKPCQKCGEIKPLDAFYKASATRRDSSCKECRKDKVRRNRQEKREQYREYERKRAMQPHRVEARKRYQQTEAGKAAIYRCSRKYRERNGIKLQAHNRVSKAISDGRIMRPDKCEACNEPGALHAHHDDYLKQLDVRWLCPACHRAWHEQHGEAANAEHPPLPQFHITRRKVSVG